MVKTRNQKVSKLILMDLWKLLDMYYTSSNNIKVVIRDVCSPKVGRVLEQKEGMGWGKTRDNYEKKDNTYNLMKPNLTLSNLASMLSDS